MTGVMPLSPLRNVPKPELGAAILALGVGVVLLAIKFVAYALTGSAAIFSDAMEGIVNVLASGFALYSIALAHQPADAAHPYGHGKIEFLSAGFEGGMIVLAAVVIALNAVDQLLFHTLAVRAIGPGATLMAVAMAVNGAVGLYLVRTGRRLGSLALVADGKHLFSDAVTSAAVLVALALVRFTRWAWADPVVAIGIAVYIGGTGLHLLRHAYAGLMDEQDWDDDRQIRAILDAHAGPAGREPRICSYHKLRHRHSGRYHWVDFHIVVPAGLNVSAGHRVASAIEHEIEQQLGEGNATAHVEPCTDAECASCAPTSDGPSRGGEQPSL
jgi:cation diffusion facilitator family transporter